MRYTKPPLNIEQQINSLKSRGLEISNQERAAHYIYCLNYYQLSGYESRLTELLKEYNAVDPSTMGFPLNWDKMNIWNDGDWHPN